MLNRISSEPLCTMNRSHAGEATTCRMGSARTSFVLVYRAVHRNAIAVMLIEYISDIAPAGARTRPWAGVLGKESLSIAARCSCPNVSVLPIQSKREPS